MLENFGDEYERCPRCRMRREGFSIYRCPSCELEFCAGCDQTELPSQGIGWMEAALVVFNITCPACTIEVESEDRIGFITAEDESEEEEASE
jgi:hypothetical protein